MVIGRILGIFLVVRVRVMSSRARVCVLKKEGVAVYGLIPIVELYFL